MSDYDWARKTAFQKIFTAALSLIVVFVFVYLFVLAAPSGHVPTLSDLNGQVAWGVLKCLLVLALFPGILLPVFLYLKAKYPSAFQHTFYRDWARLLTGRGKRGGPVYFFVEDVYSFQFQRSTHKDKPIYLATVHFKPGFLGTRSPTTVAICVESKLELQPLDEWLLSHGISQTWD